MQKVTKQILKQVYPPRAPDSHKYDFGLLLVVGGGEFYTGSPALSAMAAFRAGVDMVHILAPQRAADIIASFSPNLAALGLKGKWLDGEDLPTLAAMTSSAATVAKEKTAVVIGGGLGRTEETKQTVLDYLRGLEGKAVIDADALHAAAKDIAVIKGKNFVLTAHAFEFYVLTEKDVKELSLEEKAGIVQEAAARMGCVIVLKGQKDIISDGREVAVNATGCPAMTVGGTGDTLAGICGALLAMGATPFLAAQAACFINGKAGELADQKLGVAMLATDLIEMITEVIKI